jgi:hypothetical protein
VQHFIRLLLTSASSCFLFLFEMLFNIADQIPDFLKRSYGLVCRYALRPVLCLFSMIGMPNPYLRQRYGAVVDQVESRFDGAEHHGPHPHVEVAYAEQPRLVPLHEVMPRGLPVDSSDDELMGTDASIGYSNFPNAMHLMQTVFQPSRLLSRRVEEIIDDSEPSAAPAAPDTTQHTSVRDYQQEQMHDTRPLPQVSYQRSDIEDLIEQTRAAMRAATAAVEEHRHFREREPNVPVAAEVATTHVTASVDASEPDALTTAATGAEHFPSEVTAGDDDGVASLISAALQRDVEEDAHPAAPERPTTLAIGLNDSKTNVSSPSETIAPCRIVLQPWSCEDADAAASRRLSRRPPPPPAAQPRSEAVTIAQIEPIKATLESKKNPRHATRRSSSKSRHNRPPTVTKAPTPDMIPVTAVDSILKSVYALMAQQEKSPIGHPSTPLTSYVDPASLLRNVYSNPPPLSTADNEHVVRSTRPFTAIPAVPVARPPPSDASAQQEASLAAPPLIDSSTLPRVGVSPAPHYMTFIEAERPVLSKPNPSNVSSRFRQPTESWKQRGLGPVHLKQTDATQRKSFSTVVNTSVSKQDQVAHLNQSAKTFLRNHSPQK